MRTNLRLLAAIGLMLVTGLSASAQVDKAAARSARPLWGSCGAEIKAALERQDGVADIVIDMRSNVVFVVFKPNTHFEPKVLRDAAKAAETAFPLMQIVAHGHLVAEGDQHFFIAGQDRFLVLEPTDAAKPLPALNEDVSVVASLDDSADPMRIKIVQSGPPPEPAAPAEQAGHEHAE
jgi:hypothetical protein